MTIKIQAAKQVNAAITTIAGQAKDVMKFQGLVHDTAVQCGLHAFEHGDYTLFVSLYRAVEGVRTVREPLLTWMARYTPVRFNSDKNEFRILPEKGGMRAKARTIQDGPDAGKDAIETGNNNPFYNLPEYSDRVIQRDALSEEGFVDMVASMRDRLQRALDAEGGSKFEGDPERARGLIAAMVNAGQAFLAKEQPVPARIVKATNPTIKGNAPELSKAANEARKEPAQPAQPRRKAA